MMRRHASYFRLGNAEDDPDPNDDLWELHRKYNRPDLCPQPKKLAGPGICRKAKQAVAGSRQGMPNVVLTGRTTIAAICLMLLIRFAVLESPVETFKKVATKERRENVKELMISFKERMRAAESKRWNSPLGALTKRQQHAYTLASNLSESYGAMIMPSIWDGWKHMALAGGMSTQRFQASVDGGLRTWVELIQSLNADDLAAQTGGSAVMCPESLSAMTGSGLHEAEEQGGVGKYYDVLTPCGLHRDSTVTIVGKPVKNFYVQLMNESSAVYKFEVVFPGDAAPFILQSQPNPLEGPVFRAERCPPSPRQGSAPDVDSLHPCSEALSNPRIVKPKEELENEDILVGHFPGLNVLDETWWFPFTEDQPFVLTIAFGLQGYHISVDGNYVCSYSYNLGMLDSISAVRIGGDVLVMSVMANGLPMPKKSLPVPDHLKATSTTLDDEKVEMVLGVTSGSDQFERRMGVRRTWAQYPEIRSGRALLRFFVGLTITKNVNRRIFKEANLFKDVVILPFVDEPEYAVLKTVAMCAFMIKYTRTPYLLKTEDDTFVRVDTVLPAVVTPEATRGLLYASIEEKGLPAHEKSPWYSSEKEWPWSRYPKFPRGPGYAISRDVAAFIARQYKDRSLELFRVESVAMGNWVDLYQRQFLHRVYYRDDPTFLNKGCEPGYAIAHGQNLEQMLCLWKRLQNSEGPECCNNLAA